MVEQVKRVDGLGLHISVLAFIPRMVFVLLVFVVRQEQLLAPDAIGLAKVEVENVVGAREAENLVVTFTHFIN